MTAALDDRGWRGVVQEPERTLFDAAVESELLDDPTIEARFQAFHRAHPEVYAELVRMAFELREAGWERFGLATLWETLRYRSMAGARPGEPEPYKLNNDFRSRYSRLIADTVPELAEAFEMRALRSASVPPPGVEGRRKCGSCRSGQCSHCLGSGCDHECAIGALL